MTTPESLIWTSEIGGSQRGVTDAVVSPQVLLTFLQRESGQDVVEYGIIIATIAVVVLLGVTTFGKEITPWFSQLAGHITTVGT